MKKIILSIGSVAAIVVPIATVVSCGGNRSKQEHKDYVVTYTLADQKAKIVFNSPASRIQLEEALKEALLSGEIRKLQVNPQAQQRELTGFEIAIPSGLTTPKQIIDVAKPLVSEKWQALLK